MKQRLELTIYGIVQGVFFRKLSQEKTQSLGLAGWIKNNINGTVSILAEGEAEKLRQFLAWCQAGPGESAVGKIEEKWSAAENNFIDFDIV